MSCDASQPNRGEKGILSRGWDRQGHTIHHRKVEDLSRIVRHRSGSDPPKKL